MAETKKKRRKRVKINYGRFVAVLCIVILAGTVGFYVRRITSLHAEREALLAEREQLEQTKDEKLNELENVNDLDYIEEQARKQLKMIKPGEVLFVIDEKIQEAAETGADQTAAQAGEAGSASASGSVDNAG